MSEQSSLAPWFYHWGDPCNDNPNLYCFPCAGGSAAMFIAWREALSGINVWAAQLPGRGTRLNERPIVSMHTLLGELAAVLDKKRDRPFVLFGHSIGALVAYELAREMQMRGGGTPAALLVFGHAAPHLPLREPALSGLPAAQLRVRLKELNGTPEEVLENDELFDLFLPSLRADFKLVETYRYEAGSPLVCPIVAFAGDNDPETEGARLTEWQAHTQSWFRYERLSGDHFLPFNDQAVFLEYLCHEIKTISRGRR